MSILVNSGRKRPWEKNKNKIHILRVTNGHESAPTKGSSTETHSGGAGPVSMLGHFCRVVFTPELLHSNQVKVPELWQFFQVGQNKWAQKGLGRGEYVLGAEPISWWGNTWLAAWFSCSLCLEQALLINCGIPFLSSDEWFSSELAFSGGYWALEIGLIWIEMYCKYKQHTGFWKHNMKKMTLNFYIDYTLKW